MNEQQQNKNEEADLHKSCDFVLAGQIGCNEESQDDQ